MGFPFVHCGEWFPVPWCLGNKWGLVYSVAERAPGPREARGSGSGFPLLCEPPPPGLAVIQAVVTNWNGYGFLTCLFLMNLGDSISKYWIYKWVHVSNLQTRNIASDFTQTVPSEKQASPMRGESAVFPQVLGGSLLYCVLRKPRNQHVLDLGRPHRGLSPVA